MHIIEPRKTLIMIFSIVLRAVAEGRIGWAFWPRNSALDEVASVAGMGTWIPHDDIDNGSEQESEEEEVADDGSEDSEIEEEESEKSDLGFGVGRFGALAVND